MDVTRLHRVLRLLTLLQSGSAFSVQQLAAELHVSRRTLFRDLTTLKAAGIPCFFEDGRGYRIPSTFFLPPVNLKVSEAMGLMALAKAAAVQKDQPLLAPAVEAVRKLIAMMPPAIRDICCEMMDRVTVQPGPANINSPADPDLYAQLQHAIDQRRVVQLEYHSLFNGEGLINLRLRPYHLHYAVRAWYVIGHSELHKQTRTFKISRIRGLCVTDTRFTLRKPFDIDAYLGKAWNLIPEGQLHRVELEFTSKVAANVAEVRWHPTQESRTLPDGRCVMCFEVDGLAEVTWWLLGYGDQVLVRQPAELAERVAAAHRAAASQYSRRRLSPLAASRSSLPAKLP